MAKHARLTKAMRDVYAGISEGYSEVSASAWTLRRAAVVDAFLDGRESKKPYLESYKLCEGVLCLRVPDADPSHIHVVGERVYELDDIGRCEGTDSVLHLVRVRCMKGPALCMSQSDGNGVLRRYEAYARLKDQMSSRKSQSKKQSD